MDTQTGPASSDWLDLAGSRVLVLGAGGIGSECAKGYAAAGASVLVIDRDAGSLDALRTASESTSPVKSFQADLTESGSGQRVVDAALSMLGGLDIVLHCVGINDRRPVLDFSEDDWERILSVNLTSAFRVAQAAGRHMVAQGYGRIVLLTSVSALLAHKLHAPYAASKGGMAQMARVMAVEWASSGVNINMLAPGYIETNLTAEYLKKPGVRENLESLVPAGRLGSTTDIVGPALFLSSKHASFITGQTIYIDGGRTLV